MTSTLGVRCRLYTVLYVLTMNVFAVAGMNAQSDATSQKAIIAYVFVQDRILQPGEIAAEKLTRINYAFANIKQGRIVSGFKNDDQNLATLVSLKQRNPSLTVFVSVGGWDWSGSFSDMALTRASRKIFISSALAYVERHQLDGLDIDWEYPGQAGSTNQFRAEDTQNFTLLLEELRERFTAAERRLHRPLSLSIAAGASSSYIAHTEMAKITSVAVSSETRVRNFARGDSGAAKTATRFRAARKRATTPPAAGAAS